MFIRLVFRHFDYLACGHFVIWTVRIFKYLNLKFLNLEFLKSMTYTNEAMLQGAQFHYEALEKPTDFSKTLNISNIYICDCKRLIFIKLHLLSEIMQLFVISHLQLGISGCKGRELIDMLSDFFRFRCALLAEWSMTNM